MSLNKKKPKIALFLPSLEIGGVERVMLNFAGGLVKYGFPVDLVLIKAQGIYVRKIPASIRIVNLRASRAITSLLPLVQYLQAENPYALISGKDYANIVALLAKHVSRASTHIIISVHTTLSKHVQYALSIKEKELVPLLARYLYPHAHAVVAVSKGVADDLARFLSLPRSKISVIYNPVVSEDLYKAAKQAINHPWFLPGGPSIILSIGRLAKAKDYSTLITAFAQVKRQRNSRLAIIGEGEERLHLQYLVKRLCLEKEVWLPGSIEPPYAYLAHSSLFVLSSIWEGLSTAIIEALALGVPVVSTDCPSSPREILDNGHFGELVAVGNPDALADAIIRTLDAPRNPAPLIERANHFSVNNAVIKYLKLLGINSVSDDVEMQAFYKEGSPNNCFE